MRSVLLEADMLVNGERQEQYGEPREHFEMVAKLWSGVMGWEMSAADVALCMVLLKIVREVHGHKRDNIVDAAGYLEIYERMVEEE